MELFWRDGYAATGLDRLVRRTRASRYGLYATFGGKRDLFLATLERYSQTVMDPMLAPLEQARASVPEIRAFFDRVLEVIRQSGDARGCFICNAAFERGAVDAAAARRVRRHFDRVRRLLARALANARRRVAARVRGPPARRGGRSVPAGQLRDATRRHPAVRDHCVEGIDHLMELRHLRYFVAVAKKAASSEPPVGCGSHSRWLRRPAPASVPRP